jgi:hypothetical protein
MGDWLGTGAIASHLRQFRSFKKARAFARSLGLKTQIQWQEYCKSGKKPADIPSGPSTTYAETGWTSLGDWLGTGTIAAQLRQYRSFNKARSFVRDLQLKSAAQWYDYCRSGKKPADIPHSPRPVYNGAGWAGFGDWLGTGRIAPHLREYRSFKKARRFVRCLGLKSRNEWIDYCKSGTKPPDIPSNPHKPYAEAGWVGYPDWLGYA